MICVKRWSNWWHKCLVTAHRKAIGYLGINCSYQADKINNRNEFSFFEFRILLHINWTLLLENFYIYLQNVCFIGNDVAKLRACKETLLPQHILQLLLWSVVVRKEKKLPCLIWQLLSDNFIWSRWTFFNWNGRIKMNILFFTKSADRHTRVHLFGNNRFSWSRF